MTHRRIAEAQHQRITLAEHRPPRGQRTPRPDPHPEEKAILTAAPELAEYHPATVGDSSDPRPQRFLLIV